MKKYLFLIFAMLAVSKAHAFNATDWNYIPMSTYTELATAGAVSFASGPIQFAGVTVGSPAANSYLVLFRSTSAVFTPDIATQTLITTDWSSNFPTFIPMFEMQNDSYTYWSKLGNAKLTLWIRCPKREPSVGGYNVCPGLTPSGKK